MCGILRAIITAKGRTSCTQKQACEAPVSAPTLPIPAQLVVDLHSTLARLRIARTVDDRPEILIMERRLNWLIDTKLPRKG
jgi:hypothetical protein